jgi:signal transduction histidine kinase
LRTFLGIVASSLNEKETMSMDGRIHIIHDLTHILMEIQRHAEILLERANGRAVQSFDSSHVQCLHAGIVRMGNLLQEYRAIATGEEHEALESIPFCDWSDYFEDQVLPCLARLYGIEIQYESKLQSGAAGIIKKHSVDRICENLVDNAVAAGANRVIIELMESNIGFDLVFRDNGCGMSENQIQQLGLGFSTRSGSGHGQGFRIIHKLAADIGAIVRTPKSISGVGTEIRISFIKVGAVQVHAGSDMRR